MLLEARKCLRYLGKNMVDRMVAFITVVAITIRLRGAVGCLATNT